MNNGNSNMTVIVVNLSYVKIETTNNKSMEYTEASSPVHIKNKNTCKKELWDTHCQFI